MIYFNMAILF